MSVSENAAREARRLARAAWPVRRYPVGDEPPDDVAHLTPDERVSLVWDATCAAWSHTGRPFPDVPRSEWPGTVTRDE